MTAKEAVNEGTMTVTGTADVAALTNAGSFKADSLTVANGSETGTFEVKTLNVKGGTFTLGEGHAVETLNVADASTVKAADMIDVDTLQVEVGGELSAFRGFGLRQQHGQRRDEAYRQVVRQGLCS